MTLQEMKQRKKELGYTNEDLARLSGVPVSTVNKIFGGTTNSPRRSTLLALESVLATSNRSGSPYYQTTPAGRIQAIHNNNHINPAGRTPQEKCSDIDALTSITQTEYDNNYEKQTDITEDHHIDFPRSADVLLDSKIPYIAGTFAKVKKQGEYTLADYLALPEDMRVELIDGVFYDMAAPFVVHQFIATQIGYQLMGYVAKNKGPCKPVLSPVDVQLDKDDKTVVQPDVLILCRPEALVKNGRVFGAPDFIIEILSKSTRRKDMTLKLAKYAYAGVREYWMIDPKALKIAVYDLEKNAFPVFYDFTDKVPVGIWNGDFSLDFQEVYEYVKDYLDNDE